MKKNKREALVLGLILLIGSFLRLYKIEEYMTFLGDEGRDVIVVRRLLVNFDPILIGPGTSIGNMYLGPLYYYMMAPALLLANFSPVGPAVMIALLGIATILLVWFVGREWFGKFAGLFAASLYAVSPTVIVYSRSSWNPNIMPFFALLSIYSIWKVYQKHEFKWLIVLGISFAFVLQSHYLGLLLIPTLLLFWILVFKRLFRISRLEFRDFLQKSLFGFIIFAGLMSPVAIFDARHGWRNFSSMKQFFTARQETVSARPWNAIPKMYPIFEKVNTRLLAGRNDTAGKAVTIGMAIWLGWVVFKRRNLLTTHYSLLFFWLFFSLLGLGLYKQEIYDHYYGFFFPAPFLLLGVLSQQLTVNSKQYIKVFAISCYLLLVTINLVNSPVLKPPTMQLQRAMAVAEKVREEAKGEKYNIAVIAERNYEDGYQYFLEVWNEPVVELDPQKLETRTDQLFVICEKIPVECDPTHSPKAEIAHFGLTKVEFQWEVFGARLFKLVRTKS